MQLKLIRTGRQSLRYGIAREELEIRAGEITFGIIFGDAVRAGGMLVVGKTLSEKICKITGSTEEEAVSAIRQHSLE